MVKISIMTQRRKKKTMMKVWKVARTPKLRWTHRMVSKLCKMARLPRWLRLQPKFNPFLRRITPRNLS